MSHARRSLSQLRAAATAAEDAGLLDEHIAAEQARQALLRERLGMSEAQAERTRRQMWTWDGMSLALCLDWQPFTVNDVPAREGLVDLELRDRDEGRASWTPGRSPLTPCACTARRGGSTVASAIARAAARPLAAARPVRLEYALEPP